MNKFNHLRALSLTLLVCPLTLMGMQKTATNPAIKAGNTSAKLLLLQQSLNGSQPVMNQAIKRPVVVAKAIPPVMPSDNPQTVLQAAKSVAESFENAVDSLNQPRKSSITATAGNGQIPSVDGTLAQSGQDLADAMAKLAEAARLKNQALAKQNAVAQKKSYTLEQLQAMLYRAIINDSEQEVKAAIAAGADHSVNGLMGNHRGLGSLGFSGGGRPALVIAVELARSKAVNALLECGARFSLYPNEIKLKEASAYKNLVHQAAPYIEYAINFGDIKTALIILKNTDPEVDLNGSGQSTETLVKSLEKIFDFFEETPDLCLQFMQAIINKGYNVHGSFARYNTSQGQIYPSLWYITLARPELENVESILELLIKNGANPNQLIYGPTVDSINTPLTLAIQAGSIKAVNFLLKIGVNTELSTSPNSHRAGQKAVTALEYAVARHKQNQPNMLEIIKLLKQRGTRLK